MIVGQAPGVVEGEERRPWRGRAGATLRRWLELDEDEFYATFYCCSVTRCYPGRSPGGRGDRTPARGARSSCAASGSTGSCACSGQRSCSRWAVSRRAGCSGSSASPTRGRPPSAGRRDRRPPAPPVRCERLAERAGESGAARRGARGCARRARAGEALSPHCARSGRVAEAPSEVASSRQADPYARRVGAVASCRAAATAIAARRRTALRAPVRAPQMGCRRIGQSGRLGRPLRHGRASESDDQ